MADDDNKGSAGGDNAGDKGADKDEGGSDKETLVKLTEGMSALAKAVEGIQTNMAASRKKPEDEEEKGDEEEDNDDEELDDKTLETLPRKQFADHLIGKVSKIIEKQLKGVQKEVTSVKEGHSREKVQGQVMKLAGDHKDFWDWKDEIAEIATEMPGVSPARAYRLARMENSDKAKKLDEKYKGKGDENDGGDDTSGKGKKKFGGFTPGSSRTVQNSKMSKTEAADKAFDDIMGPFISGGEGT